MTTWLRYTIITTVMSGVLFLIALLILKQAEFYVTLPACLFAWYSGSIFAIGTDRAKQHKDFNDYAESLPLCVCKHFNKDNEILCGNPRSSRYTEYCCFECHDVIEMKDNESLGSP